MWILPSSVKGRLVLGFGTLIAITLGLGVAAYQTIVVIDQAADEVARKNSERNLAGQIL